MVRVGGGWDTLEHYLDKHDPCRCSSTGQCPAVGLGVDGQGTRLCGYVPHMLPVLSPCSSSPTPAEGPYLFSAEAVAHSQSPPC